MLSFIVQAAAQQAPVLAKQIAPNVYVTVQQPPHGMPEWVKTLLSAAVFGIATSTAMEFVKPMAVGDYRCFISHSTMSFASSKAS